MSKIYVIKMTRPLKHQTVKVVNPNGAFLRVEPIPGTRTGGRPFQGYNPNTGNPIFAYPGEMEHGSSGYGFTSRLQAQKAVRRIRDYYTKIKNPDLSNPVVNPMRIVLTEL